MSTIVSAYIGNVNQHPTQDFEFYYQMGRLLLKSSTPKILFLDIQMY